ncbi:MAG: S1 RNA-binding domain-containing protein [Candidatus Omnitrophica bacterium]|nr:S1 RNA-binding domain-containing protein [Candidatus Omnitrophota bacterium]
MKNFYRIAARTAAAVLALVTFTALLVLVALSFKQTQYLLLRIGNKNKPAQIKIETYKKFVEGHPWYLLPRMKLAGFYSELSSENPEKTEYLNSAIEQYRIILKLDPKNNDVLSRLGDLYSEKKDFDKFDILYRKLTRLAPENAVYHARLASIYYSRNMLDKALEEAETAIAKNAEDGNPHMIMGGIHEKKGETAEALAAYEAAARNFKKNKKTLLEAKCRHRLGVLYLKTGLLFDAMQQFETTIEIRPALIEPYLGLATTCALLGLNDKIISTLTGSPLNPESIDFLRPGTLPPRAYLMQTFDLLGNAYLAKKDYINALRNFRGAKTLGVRYKTGFIDYLENIARAQKGQRRTQPRALLQEGLLSPQDIPAGGETVPLEIGTGMDIPPELKQGIDVPWEEIEKKYAEGSLVTGKVVNATPYGVVVEMEKGVRGIVRTSDLSWARGYILPDEKLSPGETVKSMVLDLNKDKGEIALGIKQLTPDPWKGAAVRYHAGDRVKGTVTDVSDYGALIELEEGVEGLVTVSDLSWTKRVRHPSEVFKPGGEIAAVILNVDEQGRKIALGIKQLTPDPWKGAAVRYHAGDRVKGTITATTDHGVFVKLEPGVEGLVTISDLSWTKRLGHPSEVFDPGGEIAAVVLNVDNRNRRLRLGVKQLSPNPWHEISGKYAPGTVWDGAITNITDSGIYVELEKDLEGLLPVSRIDLAPSERAEDLFKTGETIKVKVIDVNAAQKRINLTREGVED